VCFILIIKTNKNREEKAMKIYTSHELKDMGKPIKETDCWLFFEKGKIAKHTIERFHIKNEIKKFRAELSFNKYKPINSTIN
jgi:hypothetical protein